MTTPNPAPHRPPAAADTPTAAGQQLATTSDRDSSGELVAVLDGPLEGQWFTWADWRARLDAARHTHARAGIRSPVLDYVPAGHRVPHPDPVRFPDTTGIAATTRPAPAAEAGPARAFRVLVTGSRTWTHTPAITDVLTALHAEHGPGLVIVHGACPRGADAIADRWARTHGVPVETHPADWSTGRGAGPARNAQMVATRPGLCLAFIRDASPGATGCAALAETAGIPTTRHNHPTDQASTSGSGSAEDHADHTPAAETSPPTGTSDACAAAVPVLAAEEVDEL